MSLRAHLLAPLALAACVVRPLETGESATGSTSTGTSTSGSSASTGPGDPTTGAADTGPDLTATATAATDGPATTDATTGCFLCPPDLPDTGEECDPWSQDCPEGQKCMPYSGDGDSSWESRKCVDIVRDPAGLYEPCTLGHIATGEDTCDIGMMCWFIDGNSEGICVGMCTGSPDTFGCADPDASCVLGSVFSLCHPKCDPLAPDCDDIEVCVPNPVDLNGFICNLDASGDEGQAFDPCEYLNACDPGHVCLAPAVATECDPMALGCCSPYCDTTQPNTCPGAGQECVAWYAPGQAPAGYENLGVCSLPMP